MKTIEIICCKISGSLEELWSAVCPPISQPVSPSPPLSDPATNIWITAMAMLMDPCQTKVHTTAWDLYVFLCNLITQVHPCTWSLLCPPASFALSSWAYMQRSSETMLGFMSGMLQHTIEPTPTSSLPGEEIHKCPRSPLVANEQFLESLIMSQ